MRKNHAHYWRGKEFSKEHKGKIVVSLVGNTRSLGHKHSEELTEKSRIGRKLNGWYKNREATVAKHRASKVGKKRAPFSKEWRQRLGDAERGEKSRFWKGGITPLNMVIRHSLEMRECRKAVFDRDNYTCATCNKKGVYLEAHHIQTFSSHPELRFEVSNGITLCRDCHNKTKWKEESYEEQFRALIMAKEKNFKGKFILCDSTVV